MKPLNHLIAILMLASAGMAQPFPFSYDQEHTGADCPAPFLPEFTDLPSVSGLPDPFAWSDGRGRLQHLSDWRCRRAEIGEEIQHYEIGRKPARPGELTASFSNGTLTVTVRENGQTLILTATVALPSGTGPFPAVIGMGGATGSLPASIFTSRDIARINFQFGQVMAHTQTRGNEPINRLYPDLTHMGAYSAWPWGVSRLIDGLELVADQTGIRTDRLAVTGCSFAGKMALYAGAFDERIALTIAQESGGGGYTTWRFSETLGNVERIHSTNYAWFLEGLRRFSNANVSKLPFDHHELMAMVAPRALLVTGNPGYEWLADQSGHVGSKAAERVYEALGIPDRFGHIIASGHNHCAVPAAQVPLISAFVDKFLLDRSDADTDVRITPYSTNLTPWIQWATPELGDGESFFGRATLVSPSNAATEFPTDTILVWSSHPDAASYSIQVSRDASFQSPDASFETADTTASIRNLLNGTRYLWRVRIHHHDGRSGPWTHPRQFTTFAVRPDAPALGSATVNRSRADYVTFRWNRVPMGTQYVVQVSVTDQFNSIFRSATTTDTLATFQGTAEGSTYYWRVRARNIAGDGDWSPVDSITVLLAPTDLTVVHSQPQRATLTWTDRSQVKDGYVIERLTGQLGSFITIDTLWGSANRYHDNTIDTGPIYTYRVRAFKGAASSAYSEERAVTTVGLSTETFPADYAIEQNYPNPFNPTTRIRYTVPETGPVSIRVYSLLGQEVAVLEEGIRSAGTHDVVFDASGLASGMYVYRLEAASVILTRKLTLIR